MKIGNFEVSFLNFGFFRLDGGAMFGSVPRNIWSKLTPTDEEGRIRLATRSIIIKDSSKTFLIDVGLGNKWTEKMVKILGLEALPTQPNLSSVTDVILTHLHFDHAGGISSFAPDTTDPILNFPQARTYLQRANFEAALNPNVKERASYLKENVLPLKNAKLELLDGESEIAPGLWLHRADGHTLGMQWLELKQGDQVLIFPSDLVPTSAHLPLPFHMGYDVWALKLLEEKEKLLAYAQSQNAIVAFQHDPEIVAARIGKDPKGHYCVREEIKGII